MLGTTKSSTLFLTGKIGFQTNRKVQLSPSKYFNQQLLNYSQKFSSDSDYIFFTQSIIQKLNLSNQINISMRKVTPNQLTAGILSSNFNEKMKEFIASDFYSLLLIALREHQRIGKSFYLMF